MSNRKPKVKHEVYVIIPDIKPYYGVKVTPETKLRFSNKNVKQKIENMILTTEYTVKTDRFISKTKVELNLRENEVVLLEESGRGYFVQEKRVGTFEEAQEEFDFIKGQMSKIPKE